MWKKYNLMCLAIRQIVITFYILKLADLDCFVISHAPNKTLLLFRSLLHSQTEDGKRRMSIITRLCTRQENIPSYIPIPVTQQLLQLQTSSFQLDANSISGDSSSRTRSNKKKVLDHTRSIAGCWCVLDLVKPIKNTLCCKSFCI